MEREIWHLVHLVQTYQMNHLLDFSTTKWCIQRMCFHSQGSIIVTVIRFVSQ